jgi:polyhydroxyalkanoate synthesis regulator phasin
MTTSSRDSSDKLMAMIESLRDRGDSLEVLILEMRENMTQKDKQIKAQGDILYQLIGGLFHHEKQACGIDTFVAMLHGSKPYKCREDDEEYYRQYPTTRQGDALEHRMDDLSALVRSEIYSLKSEIKNLKNRMCDVTYGLQELGAGLFNQKTQQESWKQMRDIFIHDGVYDHLKDPPVNTSKWMHPTTRQGDELEQRFDELEAKLEQFGVLFPPNKISQERIKRSVDLCGNE